MSELLLEGANRERLRELCRAPTLFAFDFDGTLAPIVLQPMEARMAGSTEALLRRLQKYAPVAVVSGRSIHDLTLLLHGFAPAALVGNHGVEGTAPGEAFRVEAARVVDCWRAQLARVLPAPLLQSGVSVEDKTYSLTLHYRHAPDTEAAHRQILAALQSAASFQGALQSGITTGGLEPAPRIIPGKDVFNLVPPGAPNKGNAVEDLLSRFKLGRCFYVGDDDTDEDVFNLEDPRVFSVRIGAPGKTQTRASYLVPEQGGIDELLQVLLSGFEPESGDA